MISALKLSYEISAAVLNARPFLLYFKPTGRCDLRCDICDRWQAPRCAEDELSLPQIGGILAKFRQAGFVILTLWGGEPTLRRDLPQILKMAHDLGLRTSICTNGNRFFRRADELAPHLDSALFSIDGIGDVHDRIRGVPGVFSRAVASIKAAKEHEDCEVKIWSAVQRGNLDQAEAIAELAAELGVGVEFFPISAVPGHNDPIVADQAQLEAVFTKIMAMKKAGLPIRNPDRVLKIMREGRDIACNFGKIAIYLDERGQVHSCESAAGEPLHSWGDYRRFKPRETFETQEFKNVVDELRSCGGCKLPCVVELSGNVAWSLGGMFLRSIRC